MRAIDVDMLIFGGGVAGLWTLDAAIRAGYSALLVEAHTLGAGQTVWSQGIIHGGLKYTLDGLMNPSAQAIREMPALWRECLAGRREPMLTATKLRAEHCYLWRTESIASRLGMIGARIGLRVAPVTLANDERPAALRSCPGTVAKLDEPVIDTVSLLENLAGAHQSSLIHADPSTLRVEMDRPGYVRSIALHDLVITPRHVVLTAGNGTDALREQFGLACSAMQVRPLHMAMVRGDPSHLPELNGHCVDGNKTRVTITSAIDLTGRRVWQVGGEIAERGVTLSRDELVAHTANELREAIPDLDLSRCEFSTYLAPRAEGATPSGRRPEDCTVVREGNVITAWPTKLVLAPRLAELVLSRLDAPIHSGIKSVDAPRPSVAQPPWETESVWRATT